MSHRICGIGEVLWDLLPSGRKPGGAPTNFAYHAAALGAHAHVISRVGRDHLGRQLLDHLAALALAVDTVEIDPTAPTGTVSVSLDGAGHPEYTIHEPVAWDNLAGEAPAQRAVAEADAVCFGTLAQRQEAARSTISRLVRSARSGALRILDVNLRQKFYTPELIHESLALANVLKVNETELPILAEMFELGGDERDIIARFAERYRLNVVAFTKGSRGSLLFRDGAWSEHPSIPIQVADTVGAGDAFTAALTLGLLLGWPLEKIGAAANRLAAYVASCSGATPPIPAELRNEFLNVERHG